MADSFPSDFYRLVSPEISPTDYPPPDSSVLEFTEFAENYLASLPKDLEWPSESKLCPTPCSQYKTSIDIVRAEEPEQYKTIVDICKLALTHYQPEKSYEFDSVLEDEEVLVTVVGYIQYILKFRAENMMRMVIL